MSRDTFFGNVAAAALIRAGLAMGGNDALNSETRAGTLSFFVPTVYGYGLRSFGYRANVETRLAGAFTGTLATQILGFLLTYATQTDPRTAMATSGILVATFALSMMHSIRQQTQRAVASDRNDSQDNPALEQLRR